MSCLSRLLGLICAVVPGLLFLAFSVRFFQLWPELGFITGPLYSLVSFTTGAICLYLGISILFGGDHRDESAPVLTSTSEAPTPESSTLQAPVVAEMAPLQAAPLPIEAPPLDAAPVEQPAPLTQSIFSKAQQSVPLDTPEARIRRLAATRPQWQVTAPQLAQLTNLNMAVVDATAREMVNNGSAHMQTGPNGETVYIFDLADDNA